MPDPRWPPCAHSPHFWRLTAMRLALITGGSRGLGLALFEQLQAQGYTVRDFSRAAPHPESIQVDLADPLACSAKLQQALHDIDAASLSELLVINNAGTLDPIGPVASKSRAQVVDNLNTNFTSAIIFISEAVAHFQAAPGRKVIANISSGAALRGLAGWSLYCAAKAGLDNFVRALAEEQRTEAAPFIAVNVNPGVMDTDMQSLIRSATPSDFPDVARFIERKKQGELRPAAVVAAAVLKITGLPDLHGGERYDIADFVV